MCAVGVGGAYAVDVMAGLPWKLKAPRVQMTFQVALMDIKRQEEGAVNRVVGSCTGSFFACVAVRPAAWAVLTRRVLGRMP